MTTQINNWKEELKIIHPEGDCCGCYEGDLDELYPEAHKKLENFIEQQITLAKKEERKRVVEIIKKEIIINDIIPHGGNWTVQGVIENRNKLLEEIINKID